MVDGLLEILAPHHCYGCQKVGTLLCDNCKYDIISDSFLRCVACGVNEALTGVCAQCSVPYQRAWCVGERTGELQKLIGSLKFKYIRAAYLPLADLVDSCLADLPPETVVVPIPTTASHIRERGFDHAKLIAGRIAKKRKLKMSPIIERAVSTKQRDANRWKRFAQAKEAFRVSKKINPDVPYLIVDDVVTTGATVYYAAKALHGAGANVVWVAAIARQTLD